MQILYLEAHPELELRRDGPALVVKAGDAAPRLFPLARLQRVVLHKSARMELADLVVCMEAGVVFCFTDRRGKPRAWGLRGSGGTGLDQLWQQFHCRTDHQERLHEWLRLRLQAALKETARSLGQPEDESAEWLMQVFHQWTVRFAGEADATQTLEWMQTEIEGLLQQGLQRLGLAGAETPLLSARLLPAAAWRLEPARLAWLRRRHSRAWNRDRDEPLSRRTFMNFLEENRESLNRSVDGLLEQFTDWLASLRS